nr:insulinase family protein [Saprospiraceae bacterium]
MKNLISIICIAILFSQCSKKTADLAQSNAGSLKVEAFRSKAPGAAPARNIDLGEYNSFDMANGLKVIIVENHKLPVVSYQVSLLNDPIKENDMVGYVSFAGDMMSKGTKTKTKGEIDEAIDYIGASLNTSSRGVFASSLKKHSTNLLGVMTDVLFNPSFPEAEFDKIKKQSLSSLATSKTDAQSISDNISGVVN